MSQYTPATSCYITALMSAATTGLVIHQLSFWHMVNPVEPSCTAASLSAFSKGNVMHEQLLTAGADDIVSVDMLFRYPYQ